MQLLLFAVAETITRYKFSGNMSWVERAPFPKGVFLADAVALWGEASMMLRCQKEDRNGLGNPSSLCPLPLCSSLVQLC